MHENSYNLMAELLAKHGPPGPGDLVYDVGSQDVNGTYRPLVEQSGATYRGLDIVAGPNVDALVPKVGSWLDVIHDKAPLVISGQCLEHTAKPWVWIKQAASLVALNGKLIVIAPWRWEVHRYPIDAWRILPDGMVSLFAEANLRLLETGIRGDDCFGVAENC